MRVCRHGNVVAATCQECRRLADQRARQRGSKIAADFSAWKTHHDHTARYRLMHDPRVPTDIREALRDY